MTIPHSTTTIAVVTTTQPEPYEPATGSAPSSTGTRAVIGAPTGREGMGTGSAEVIDAVLLADPLPALSHGQTVLDETTSETWEVVWVHQRRGLGLDHTRAGLRRVER